MRHTLPFRLQHDDNSMTDPELLARIPGEYVGLAAESLPHAATSGDTFRNVAVQLPDGRRVVITFRRLSHQHGRARHWFWSAIRAVPADAEEGANDRATPLG